MLNSRNTALVAVALLLVGVATTAQANTFVTSTLEPGRYTTVPNAQPLAPQSITQSTDPNTVTSGASVACTGGSSSWWRLFDLDDDHALTGQFCVEDIDYGIESLTANQTLGITLYCLAEGSPFTIANLVQTGSANVPHTPTSLTLHNAAVAGCCDADTEDLAVRLANQSPGFFMGANSLGQSAPSYITATDCGVSDPLDLAAVGFPNSHLVLVVNGDGEGGSGDGGGDGGGVPASTDLGMLLMVLALLGSSAYFLRRRATN